MNYLAHAYLSFNRAEILVGNMISDFVKGKAKFNYPPAIQQGIMLHRAIDTFTDGHAATHEAKQLLKPAVGLYAGAFVDVVFDHFLATDKNEFENTNKLMVFSQTTYRLLEPYEDVFPERFKKMFPFMQQHNWLYNYQFHSGIESSFGGVARRAKYLTDSSNAFSVFENNYDAFKNYYVQFFPSVKKFVLEQLNRTPAEL